MLIKGQVRLAAEVFLGQKPEKKKRR